MTNILPVRPGPGTSYSLSRSASSLPPQHAEQRQTTINNRFSRNLKNNPIVQCTMYMYVDSPVLRTPRYVLIPINLPDPNFITQDSDPDLIFGRSDT